MRIRVIIKDKNSQWEEELPVESLETAKKDIQNILNSFNSSLRIGELPRKLVKILSPKTIEEKTTGEVFKDIELILRDLRHEVCNAYGSAWLKADNNYQFKKFMKAYDKMIETGKSKSFKNCLVLIFQNVRDICNAEDLKYLCDYNFDNKLKIKEEK